MRREITRIVVQAVAPTRRGILAGATALVASPFTARGGSAQAKAANVGVILPLSGANAQFGINSRNGIDSSPTKLMRLAASSAGRGEGEPDCRGRQLDANDGRELSRSG